MSTLSLCMIVKNEEDVIGRCLECVKDIVDEIIIVDTGSKDGTKEIVKKYTDKIYDFIWIDDFSAARNYSFSKATKEYIMWLDADDVILEEDRKKLKELKNKLKSSIDMVLMKYNVAFDKAENPTFSYDRERIMRRSIGYKWIGEIHEVISQYGNIIYSDIAISHKKLHPSDPMRNIKIFEKMIEDGKKFDPRQEYYYARELYFHSRYYEAIDRLEKFIESGEGWIENSINACADLSKCYEYIGDDKKRLSALLRSFQFDEPRAEICCDMGKYFIDKEEYDIAIFWYKLALTKKTDERAGGFKLIDCYGYIPYMQLCVCYDKIGNIELAEESNGLAASIKPNDSAVLYNKRYFEGLVKNKV